MKELKIGETITIKCVEDEGCEKCICEKMNIDCPTLCSQYHRTDGKDVHFEIVEENQCPSDETIMRVLNCIGYEDRSWIEFVKRHWNKTKEV